MAEVPCPVIVVNLCGEKADASRKLGYTVDILVAGIAERYTARGGCIAHKRAVVSTELRDI